MLSNSDARRRETMSAHEAHPAWSFHFLPFFFLGLGGPPGTWGGAATRGGDAMRGLNIRSIHSSRCCLHLAASSDWRLAHGDRPVDLLLLRR